MTRYFNCIFAAATAVAMVSSPALAPAKKNYCRSTASASRFCDGCVIDRTITVRTGSSCVFKINANAAALLGIDFPVRPKAGQAGRANAYSYGYQAGNAPGPDYFETVVRWESRGAAQKTSFRNRVTIVAPAR